MKMQKKYYFDNAAATRLDERVLETMAPYYFDSYSVATSEFGYSMGLEAREAMDSARAVLSALLGAQPEEIVFTSGSTESSNLAIKGVAMALSEKKGKHVIVSAIEDFPVLYSAHALEKMGFTVDIVDVDEYGFVNLQKLSELITDKTALVSIQHANQEIGTLQDIDTIARLCHEKHTLLHADATHTFGRVPIDAQKLGADLMTVSADTIHGPKGVGGLYIRRGTPITKVTDGGFQEFNLRAGAENVPGVVGFAKAAQLVTPEENEQLRAMRDRIFETVSRTIPKTTLNGHPTKRTPQNANVTFHLVEGESITLHLDMYGISVSTGSACFSRSVEGSHVIKAIGGDHERMHGSIRMTMGRFNTMDEVDFIVEKLGGIVEQLRKISPLGKE
jgi:cysteine desulfurase